MAEHKTWQMFIGGEWVNSSSGETEPNVDPSTGEAVATVQIGTREDADKAVAAAQKAFDEVWLDTPPKERSAMLLQLADALDADADNLALLESEDVGKPIAVSAADIPFITAGFRQQPRGDRHYRCRQPDHYRQSGIHQNHRLLACRSARTDPPHPGLGGTRQRLLCRHVAVDRCEWPLAGGNLEPAQERRSLHAVAFHQQS